MLKKSNFIFVFEPSLFMEIFIENKRGMDMLPVLLRLPNMFKSYFSLKIYLRPIFDPLI